MYEFCVQGVVKGGQVVLEVPLDLPDGTVVFVADHAPDDVEVVGPKGPPPPEVVKKLFLSIMKRNDLLDEPEWRATIEADRVAATEKLILQMAGMWADRPETADPDKWVRRQWGRDE